MKQVESSGRSTCEDVTVRRVTDVQIGVSSKSMSEAWIVCEQGTFSEGYWTSELETQKKILEPELCEDTVALKLSSCRRGDGMLTP